MDALEDSIPPTLFEKFLGLVPLPYTITCMMAALILGTPGALITRYIDSLDFDKTLYITGFVTGSISYYRAVAFYWILTYIFFLFYLYYFIRHFRLKTIEALSALSPLLQNRSKINDFRLISNPYGSILTTLIVAAGFAPSVYRMIGDSLGPLSAIQVLFTQALLDFGGGTGIWIFFSSIWSLRKLSKEKLELQPYSKDPLLGLGPIGSISLELVMIFFGALGLRGFGIFISGVAYTSPVFNLAFESVLIISGLILFYSTINIFHLKMVGLKILEKKKISEQTTKLLLEEINQPHNTNYNETITKNMLSDIMKRRVEKMPTWPFEIGVLNRILTILISVISIITARLIMSALSL